MIMCSWVVAIEVEGKLQINKPCRCLLHTDAEKPYRVIDSLDSLQMGSGVYAYEKRREFASETPVQPYTIQRHFGVVNAVSDNGARG